MKSQMLNELQLGNEYVLMDYKGDTDQERNDSMYNGRDSQSSRMIVNDNGDVESVHSVESGQSSKRATNYFDDDLYIS